MNSQGLIMKTRHFQKKYKQPTLHLNNHNYNTTQTHFYINPDGTKIYFQDY